MAGRQTHLDVERGFTLRDATANRKET